MLSTTLRTLLSPPLLLHFVFASVAAGGEESPQPESPQPESPQPDSEYDPLSVEGVELDPAIDCTLVDRDRERPLPVRIYLPPRDSAAPVVVFSHGLGGSRSGSVFLGKHWAMRGFACVFLQHPGSDDSVWKGVPPEKRMGALRKAASLKNMLSRVADVKAVIDQLAIWNEDADHDLSGRLDLGRIGMAGHSFGAVTTQAVSGQSFLGARRFTDDRIQAAVAFSPSAPRLGDPARAFQSVTIPWMLMTGTNDVAPIGQADVASRREVYENLPGSIDRYEVVLDGAEHSAFSDRSLPGDREARNPNHHRVVLALSTAFWEWHLNDDPAARAWLRGDSVRGVLEEADAWQLEAASDRSGRSGGRAESGVDRRPESATSGSGG